MDTGLKKVSDGCRSGWSLAVCYDRTKASHFINAQELACKVDTIYARITQLGPVSQSDCAAVPGCLQALLLLLVLQNRE